MRLLSATVLFLPLLVLAAADAPELPVAVAPDAPELWREGRFSDDHRFAWTYGGASVRFTGTAANVVLRLTKGRGSAIQVVVDGEPTGMVEIKRDQTVYPLASGLEPGEHVIDFRKRPEGHAGELAFGGFQLSEGAEVLPLAPPERRILVLGDSISCGYGNEAERPGQGNSHTNENGYLAYGPIAGRALGAETTMVCWSGKGMYRNRDARNDRKATIPELFDRTLPQDGDTSWDHASWVPDVIVINLGTNDLHRGKKNPKPKLTEEMFIGAYGTFADRLRELYPEATIIAAVGPMVHKPFTGWLSDFADAREGVGYLHFEGRKGMEWVGGHWHPSVKMHRLMGETLAAKIGELTGWKPAADE